MGLVFEPLLRGSTAAEQLDLPLLECQGTNEAGHVESMSDPGRDLARRTRHRSH
jgi:hypothetical protein